MGYSWDIMCGLNSLISLEYFRYYMFKDVYNICFFIGSPQVTQHGDFNLHVGSGEVFFFMLLLFKCMYLCSQ